ncbi:MAG: hypothetical protein R8K49_03395 [Mariprofundaceae bacterium]
MRLFLTLTILWAGLALTACEPECEQHTSHNPSHNSVQIKQLNMLTQHAISMMAAGAQLKLSGSQYGDVLLTQSANLLRRSMSGPEMSAMHHDKGKASTAMQYSHNLGAAAFDLLELMMDLSPAQDSAHNRTLHQALSLAAQAVSLSSLVNISTDINTSMQQHGTIMLSTAKQLAAASRQVTDYQKSILQLLNLLQRPTSQVKSHTH